MENQNKNQTLLYFLFITVLIISNIITYFFIKKDLEIKLKESYKISEILPFCKKEIINNFQDEDYINYIILYNQVTSKNIKNILPSITVKSYLDVFNQELVRLDKEVKDMKILYNYIYKKDHIDITEKDVKMLTDDPFIISLDFKINDINDQNIAVGLFRGSLELISKNYYIFALNSKNPDISKNAQDFFNYKEIVIKNITKANLSARNN